MEYAEDTLEFIDNDNVYIDQMRASNFDIVIVEPDSIQTPDLVEL